ncbi:MAG: GNAT family N-acetyltransferase [Planctomycetota bacterium]
MTPPLVHRNLALAQRLERAEVAITSSVMIAAREADPKSPATSIDVAGGKAMILGPGSPFNSVKGMGLHGPVTPADLDTVETFFASHGGGVITVDVCPLADPSLWTLLGERGYRLAEFENVLVRPIRPSDRDQPETPGVTVTEATQGEGELYARTLGLGFSDGAEPPEWMMELGRNALRIRETTRFLARLDGHIVGASGLRILDGMVAFLGTAVLPEARGRGVQTAIIRERLRRAAEMGCDLAKVDVKPGLGSHRNFERHGFSIAYTRAQAVKTLATN